MNENEKDPKLNRARRKLVVATSVVGGAAGLAAAAPFVASMLPSERARAAGAPVEGDARLAEGGGAAPVRSRIESLRAA
jgi:ubiquinol-cytochrome c reductase iron-sulfur subunit